MITRADYMEKRATHEEYYGDIVRDCGALSLPVQLSTIRKALADGDEHLNSIPLKWWDHYGEMQRSRIAPHVCKRQTGGCSLSDLVCILKQAARMAVAD